MGFLSLKKIIDIELRIFFYKYSYAVSISNILFNNYRKILKAIDKANDEIEFNKEKVSDNTFLDVLE